MTLLSRAFPGGRNASVPRMNIVIQLSKWPYCSLDDRIFSPGFVFRGAEHGLMAGIRFFTCQLKLRKFDLSKRRTNFILNKEFDEAGPDLFRR
jgi:hypothetical protein